MTGDRLEDPASMTIKSGILIVDDDAQTRLALRELLRSPDRHIVVAGSGEEALRHVLKEDFAVILLDARMTGMDGFETARLIRERERSRHIPIIFLTGAYEDTLSAFRGYEVGAVDYLLKPVVPEVLRSKIAVFIELHSHNVALAREVQERKLVEQELRRSEEGLRAFAARIQSVREEERTRIAREIHDELGQSLTGLKMDLSWLAKHLPKDNPETAKKLSGMFALIDATVKLVRRIAAGLRPQVLDDVGLVGALKWQAREFQTRTGLRCRTELPGDDVVLEQEQATAVFRIFQEVLTNVARHAKATRVDIDLQLNGENLTLKIADNGRGIEASELEGQQSLGLLGIRERALLFGGTVDIKGAKNKGTTVTVMIPRRQMETA
jgi:signal transduction histidine kinase